MKNANFAIQSIIIACFTVASWTNSVQAHPASFSSAAGRPSSLAVNSSASFKIGKVGAFANAIRTIGIGPKVSAVPPMIFARDRIVNIPVATITVKPPSPSTPGQPGQVSDSTVPTSSSMANQQITAVLNGDWSSWTGSANGSLTLVDIGKLLTNPNIKGSQAAVLGMIADQMNSDISNNPNVSPSYTFAHVQQNVFGANNSASAAFGTASYALSYYIQVAQQIASSTNGNGSFNLYGSFSGPQLTGIQQGALGDCYYLSAMEAVLNESPQLIAKMIVQNANGTFTVSFPQGPKETVSLTDSEIANFNLGQNNGCWLAVMGLAENNVLVGLSTSTNKQIKNTFAITAAEKATPLGVVSDGGYPTQSLNLVTGVAYNVVANTQSRKFTVNYVDQLLTTDFANKSPIGVDSYDHSLSIIGWNAQTQTVTILNPWGTSGSYGYNEDSGVSNHNMEVNMVNGVFTLTTRQMLQDFSEIAAPATYLGTTGTITSAVPHNSAYSASAANMLSLPAMAPHMVSMNLSAIANNQALSLANSAQSNLTANIQTLTAKVPQLAGFSAVNLDALSTKGSARQTTIVDSCRSSKDADSDRTASVVDTGEYCADQGDDEVAASF